MSEFSNCRFKICDLPGQCRSEGKCHHPAVPASLHPAMRLTDEQIIHLFDQYTVRSFSNEEVILFARQAIVMASGVDLDKWNENPESCADAKPCSCSKSEGEICVICDPATGGLT